MEKPHNSPEHQTRHFYARHQLTLVATLSGALALANVGFSAQSRASERNFLPFLHDTQETNPPTDQAPVPESPSPEPFAPTPTYNPPKPEHREQKPSEYGCTSIRDSKDGRYYGLACKSGGDKFTPIGEQKYEDRPYGVFYIKHQGIYMCGYGNDVLDHKPKSNLPKTVGSYCVRAQPRLENRNSYFTDHNCKLIKGTSRDSCSDGKEIAIKESCTGAKRRLYGLFIPSRKSVLNVLGKKVKHPFSRLRSENTNVKNVFYRFEVKSPASWHGKQIKSAVVRTRDVDGNLGWGHKRSECIPKHGRKGGPPARNPKT